MTHADPRRIALLHFALGHTAAADLIAYSADYFGDEDFAVEYLIVCVRAWLARQTQHHLEREAAMLIATLSDRCALLEQAVAELHEREYAMAYGRLATTGVDGD